MHAKIFRFRSTRRAVAIGLCSLALCSLGPVAGAAPVLDDFRLQLGGISFDPKVEDPAALLPAAWRQPAGLAPAPGFQLIQLQGPTRAGWLESLSGAGYDVVQYIHPFTYVVWPSPGAKRAGDLPFVRWSGAFETAYKVAPKWRELAAADVRVKILIYRGGDADHTLGLLRGAGFDVIGSQEIDSRFVHAVLEVPGNRLGEIAALPAVYTVQLQATNGGHRGEMANQVAALNVDGGGLAVPGYVAWLSSAGVNGSGVIMANVDGGVAHTHPDLVNRMVACVGSTCGGAATDNHGTHTAGIMAADGASGTLDVRGFLRGQGVAPGANLVEQVYSPTFTQPGGMSLLMQQSSENGAVLSGNSWGPSGSPEGYDSDTLQVDISARDAEPGEAGNQEFLYVLSIMNGNGGTSSQGSPDEAKNVLTVGSTRMQQSGGGAQLSDMFALSSNSGHGPALDGRKIPHIVAPGCSVDSTTSSTYGLLCGTSMASPMVAGSSGLVFQQYRAQNGGDNPSPSLVKAMHLATAIDLFGHPDADNVTLGHRFDSKQGWGRLDLRALLQPVGGYYHYDQQTTFDATGESWDVELSRVDPSAPVRIMLVWMDAPGHGLGGSTPAWNNDLDLEVTAGADTYLGNVIGGDGWSATGGSADDRNNTEGVMFPPTTGPATFTVTVSAANIASDGVPGVGDGTDQDFALVCFNCTAGEVVLFEDGFESGSSSAWDNAVP